MWMFHLFSLTCAAVQCFARGGVFARTAHKYSARVLQTRDLRRVLAQGKKAFRNVDFVFSRNISWLELHLRYQDWSGGSPFSEVQVLSYYINTSERPHFWIPIRLNWSQWSSEFVYHLWRED